mgnify:CR=1 FL=1
MALDLLQGSLRERARAGLDVQQSEGLVERHERIGYAEGQVLGDSAKGRVGGAAAAPVREEEGVVIGEGADSVGQRLGDVFRGGWGLGEDLDDGGGNESEEDGDETLPEGRVTDTREAVLAGEMAVVVAEADDKSESGCGHDDGLQVRGGQEETPPDENEGRDGGNGTKSIRVTFAGTRTNVPCDDAHDTAENGTETTRDERECEIGHVDENAGLGGNDTPNTLLTIEKTSCVGESGGNRRSDGNNDHAHGIHASRVGQPVISAHNGTSEETSANGCTTNTLAGTKTGIRLLGLLRGTSGIESLGITTARLSGVGRHRNNSLGVEEPSSSVLHAGWEPDAVGFACLEELDEVFHHTFHGVGDGKDTLFNNHGEDNALK